MDLQIAADRFFKTLLYRFKFKSKDKMEVQINFLLLQHNQVRDYNLFSSSLSNHEKSAIYPLCRHYPFPLTFFEFEDVYKQLN